MYTRVGYYAPKGEVRKEEREIDIYREIYIYIYIYRERERERERERKRERVGERERKREKGGGGRKVRSMHCMMKMLQ